MNPFSSLLDIYLPQRVYNREYQAQQQRAQGLLGTPTVPGADDGLGLAGLGQAEQMGTGLLGNQITPMQYAQQMSAIPMYKTQGPA